MRNTRAIGRAREVGRKGTRAVKDSLGGEPRPEGTRRKKNVNEFLIGFRSPIRAEIRNRPAARPENTDQPSLIINARAA